MIAGPAVDTPSAAHTAFRPLPAAPLVGVVIPTYNSEDFLPETLDSVLSQAYGRWRCVVVDDGSSDGSVAVAERYAARDARITVLTQPNRGVCAARNRGLSTLPSEVDLVTFMDNDDCWSPQALASLVAELHRHQDRVGGVHGLAETVGPDGELLLPGSFSGFMAGRSHLTWRGPERLEPTQPTDLRSVLFVNRVYPPGVLLVRREVYDVVGPWDERFAAVGDWDMVQRVTRVAPLGFLPDVVLHYRRHDRNESSLHERNVRETRLIQAKVYASSRGDAGLRRTIRREWRAWQLEKLRELYRSRTLAPPGSRGGRATTTETVLRLGLLLLGRPPWRLTRVPFKRSRRGADT